MSFSLIRDWGPLDECGARNLIDRDATLRGMRSVMHGIPISLGLLVENGSRGPAAAIRPPAQHYMIRDGGDYAAGLSEKPGYGFADDVVVLPVHGTTHIDALCHVWQGGRMYNNFSANEVTSRGAARCGIEKLEPVVTRGLFVDLGSVESDPARAIGAAELERAIEQLGITPRSGDALVLRTGWLKAWREGRADISATAGLHHDCAEVVLRHGFALVAADNIAVEVVPSKDPLCAIPLHIRLLRDGGVYFCELLDLEALSAHAPKAFMLTVAPLRIRGGAGSPVNPVAVI